MSKDTASTGLSPWEGATMRKSADLHEKNQLLQGSHRERSHERHSSVLAWRVPGTGELGGLLSMGSHRVGHD